MKLYADRVSDSPTAERFEAASGWFAPAEDGSGADALLISRQPVFDLMVHAMRRDIYLEGSVALEVEATCSRCLRRYCQPLRETYRLVLAPASGVEMSDPESAEALQRDGLCLGEELEAGWYQGKELHLDRFFNEVVALALPQAPLCREDCTGLCPTCGNECSEASCTCNEIKPDSPFAALAALRDQGVNGES